MWMMIYSMVVGAYPLTWSKGHAESPINHLSSLGDNCII